MKYSMILPLAGLAIAAPAWEDAGASSVVDACAAAVTGKAALGDDKLRKDHCSSFLHTIVTPPAVTVTSTVTGKPGKHEKRTDVTVCPNEVPNYASACDEEAYSTACSKYGVTGVITETLAPTTTTVFVWVGPTGGAGVGGGNGGHGGHGNNGGETCEAATTVTVTEGGKGPHGGNGGKTCEAASTVTVTEGGKGGHGGNGDKTITVTQATATVTVTEGGNGGHGGKPTGKPGNGEEEVTVTVTEIQTITEGGNGGHGGKPTGGKPEENTATVTKTVTEDKSCPTGKPGHDEDDKCLSDDDALKLVNNFRDLLEYTSYNGTQGAPGRGYHFNVSAATLDPAFVDISDSINFMAGFPLGSVTFASKNAFDYGQGVMQPEVKTETLNIFHDCKAITWRWKLTPGASPVNPKPYPVVGINYMMVNEKKLLIKNYAEFDNGAWLQNFGKQCAANTPVKVVDGEWAKKM